jgi:saccharopine dehydrogenase-like NADP-dependent oxidoreductase
MVAGVLIIGGYAHFGSYIARSLAGDAEIRLLVAGRSVGKAQAFIASIRPIHAAEAHAIDINGELPEALSRIAPDVVIHTSGPFRSQDHRVACACADQGRHYLDLADASDFVATIGRLDAAAKARDVVVISGANSVPCLTAAIVDAYLPCFARATLRPEGWRNAVSIARNRYRWFGHRQYCARLTPEQRTRLL